MHILHTESSNGWGGQEIRILKECLGMRERGHEVILAVAKGGGLVAAAHKEGFLVYEITFKKKAALFVLLQLTRIIRKHDIDLVNTHSSLDAWLGGIAARMMTKKIVRTRHLSTPIRKGLNSRLLYKRLCDYVVTTSSAIIPTICAQGGISSFACRCIPTGVDPSQLVIDPEEVRAFRDSLKLSQDDILVGTVCFVRSWKGIHDFMKAARLLKDVKQIKWVVVGGGHVKDYIGVAQGLGLEGTLTFTGHLNSPFAAMAAMDIFALLSTANEGISQASLQAAFLQRPLITTSIGGLPEVCIEGKTGLIVPSFSPDRVAQAVLKMAADRSLRKELGNNASMLVKEKYTIDQTLDRMESVYKEVLL